MSDEPCRFGCAGALAIFEFDRGCVCYPDDREQALCLQHIVRSTPLGSMTLKRDLTIDGSLTRDWQSGKLSGGA